MKKIIFFLFYSFILSFAFSTDLDDGIIFSFKYKLNDATRIISTVDENVYINGVLSHRAKILNRIFCKITEIYENGSGKNEATFMTSEAAVSATTFQNFSWGNEYDSIFIRDKSGKYEIGDEYFMPTVRDVPLFLDVPVKKGDEWIGKGHEVHDLRGTFNIKTPFKVPFTASYKYIADEIDEKAGNVLNLIEVKYNIYFESPKPLRITQEVLNAPKITSGYSHQKIWWNNEKGEIDHYSESFEITIQTFYGDKVKFAGTAHAETSPVEKASTDENLKKITNSVSSLGYDDIDVKRGEKGVTISIENIQFEPDSSILMKSEKAKLQKIAEILKTFDNDLLVTGHCADRGTKQNQERISQERANAVAKYLSSLKIRNPNCIFTEAKGATAPLASNATEYGRQKNRRVEITIIDE